MSTLHTVQKALVGGIEKLEIAPVSWVAHFASLRSLSLPAVEIALDEGRQWISIPAIDDTITYSEEEERSGQGLLAAKRIQAFLAHDDLANRQVLASLALIPLVVRYTDRSGNKKIAATPSEPMELSVSYQTESRQGRIGFPLSLSGVGRQRSYFIIDPPQPQFSINADGELIYEGDLKDNFSINADGELIATGDTEYRYAQNSRGELIFT